MRSGWRLGIGGIIRVHQRGSPLIPDRRPFRCIRAHFAGQVKSLSATSAKRWPSVMNARSSRFQLTRWFHPGHERPPLAWHQAADARPHSWLAANSQRLSETGRESSWPSIFAFKLPRKVSR